MPLASGSDAIRAFSGDRRDASGQTDAITGRRNVDLE